MGNQDGAAGNPQKGTPDAEAGIETPGTRADLQVACFQDFGQEAGSAGEADYWKDCRGGDHPDEILGQETCEGCQGALGACEERGHCEEVYGIGCPSGGYDETDVYPNQGQEDGTSG